MSTTEIAALRRELAEQIADRFPDEADVDRYARAVGLSVGEIDRESRPIDHWSAAITHALEKQCLEALLTEIKRDLPDLRVERYAILWTTAAADRPPSLALELRWDDLDVDQPWRLERPGNNCRLAVKVIVTGGTAAPVLDWRHRRLGGFGRWERASLVQANGRQVWTAETNVKTGVLRTRRVDVRCTHADQLERVDRIVVARPGYFVALGLLVATTLFVAVWVSALPALAAAFGFGGAAAAMGVGGIRDKVIQRGTRGPARGFGVFERAFLIGLVGPLAAVFLPPLLFVVIENHTSVQALAVDGDGERLSLVSGEKRTLWRWNLPLKFDPTAGTCVCPSVPADPACPCAAGEVRGVPVYRVVCKQERWDLGALAAGATALVGAERRDGQVWRKMKATCEPEGTPLARFPLSVFGGTGNRGTVEVWPPWRADFAAAHLEANALAALVRVAGTAAPTPGQARVAEPVMRVLGAGARGTLAIPLHDPTWTALTLELLDETERPIGTLQCKRLEGLGRDLHIVLIEGPLQRARVRTDIASEWEGGGAARVCASPGRGTAEPVELSLTTTTAGTAFTLPPRLHDAPVELTLAGARLTAAPCSSKLALIDLDTSSPPSRLSRGTRSWTFAPVRVGTTWRALLCDPPASEISVRDPSNKEWLLSARRLRKPGPATLVPVPGSLPGPGTGATLVPGTITVPDRIRQLPRFCKVPPVDLARPTITFACQSPCRLVTAANPHRLVPPADRRALETRHDCQVCFCPS